MSSPSDKAISIEDLRLMARKRLPRSVFDFFDGGAEDEITLQENISSLAGARLVPRVLRGAGKVDMAATLVGAPSSLPMAIAPTGALGYGRPGSDLAIARAAVAAGIPYTLSSAATTSLEKIASAAPGRLWFQAYVISHKAFLYQMIERARIAEYEALVITVDLPVGGKRERDARNDFSVPFRFTRRNVFDFARNPGWVANLLRHGMPTLENYAGMEEVTGKSRLAAASALASTIGQGFDTFFDWEGLKAIRDQWPRKLIVKGVVHPEDASRLADLGCDAIVVSNHGGRQLDGGIASFDALPGVVQGVAGRIPVLMDGGIRRGGDIAKALAAGAQGVLTGRATLYGAMADGQAGAARAIAILQDELKRTMKLCGLHSLNDISPQLLSQRPC